MLRFSFSALNGCAMITTSSNMQGRIRVNPCHELRRAYMNERMIFSGLVIMLLHELVDIRYSLGIEVMALEEHINALVGYTHSTC